MTYPEFTPDSLDEYMVFTFNDEQGACATTEGMRIHELPDLSIENIRPQYLVAHAAELLHRVADYLIETHADIRDGQTILLGPDTVMRFSRREVEGRERWLLEEARDVICPECEGADHEIYVPPWRRSAPN